MAFVSFSAQSVIDGTTAVSNVFIDEHLPVCNGDCVRVYLYGLSMCASSHRYDNTPEHFARILGLGVDDVMSAYQFWQDRGLVQILSVTPVEIKYLPVIKGAARAKGLTREKYADFNAQMQSVIEGRMITPNEFSEYHSFLETFRVEPSALVMVAKYCLNTKKKDNLGYTYILTVAKNLAANGIRTAKDVEQNMCEIENMQKSAKARATFARKINKIIGVYYENVENIVAEYLGPWSSAGFDDASIEAIANFCFKTGRRTLASMNVVIGRLTELGLTSPDAVNLYITENEKKVSPDDIAKNMKYTYKGDIMRHSYGAGELNELIANPDEVEI